MSSGHIELAAQGKQDVFLTGSPQVTYFAGKYNQHTPFVLEAYDIPFNGQDLQFGTTSICRIPAKGDLIRALTLRLTLPALYDPGTDWYWPTFPTGANFPRLSLGLPDGTIVGPLVGSTTVPYYSSVTSPWASQFSPYITYSQSQNKFLFSQISNIIVQSTVSTTAAQSPLFWGLDPSDASYASGGTLVYNATAAHTFVPQFTLQLAGWIGCAPTFPASQSQIYLNLAQWSSGPGILSSGMYQFPNTGYYVIQSGFSFTSGGINSLGYGTTTSSIVPVTPVLSQNYILSSCPNATPPIILPVTVTNSSLNYYLYAGSGGTAVSLTNGSYIDLSPVDVVLSVYPASVAVPVTFTTPTLPTNVTLPGPNTSFSNIFGPYLVSGVIQLTSGNPSSVTIGGYTYTFPPTGINPSWPFITPLVSSSYATHYTISSTSPDPLANYNPGTFFALQNLSNGIILQQNQNSQVSSTGLINLNNFIASPGSANPVTINGAGSVTFSGLGYYMLTAIFTGLPTTGVSSPSLQIKDASGNVIVNFPIGVWSSTSYTISFPFEITSTIPVYSVYLLHGTGTTIQLGSGTYIAIYQVQNPNIPSKVLFPPFNYYDSVGTLAIETADLKIGGQTIQSLTGEYIELWNELNVPYENQPGLKFTTGKYDINSSVGPPGRTYYVNLPFYFYGYPELSLPIVALDRHAVEVWVNFKNFTQLTSVSVTRPVLSASIITDYVYLAEPEVNWFKTHCLDYVITQTQYQTFNIFLNQTTHILPLNISGPVKELIFVLQNVGSAPYDYSNNGLKSIGLTFNGQDALLADQTDALYLGTIEPMNKHVNFFSKIPGINTLGRQFFLYSFAKDPMNPQPTGQVNMSRISQILLELNLTPPGPVQSFRVAAINYNVLRVENGIGGIMFK